MNINFQNKDPILVAQAIQTLGHTLQLNDDGTWLCSDFAAVQAIIDALPEPMPDLEPRQFKLMVAGVGLVPLIEAALGVIGLSQTPEAREMFKSAYSQYEGGTKYFWDKSLFEWQRLSPMFEAMYHDVYGEDAPPFTLDEDDLRAAWIESSTL